MSTPQEIQQRFQDLEAVAKHYRKFEDFYFDCSVDLLGFEPTDQQLDIARYVANGPLYAMVQAQRGEAKTTITGCYAVWCLVQNPTFRVLIVSAGTPMAKQIATWCIQIIYGLDVLEPLRPDKNHMGTRTSVEAFDVHHELKGAEKSPSIACLGITSTMQGYRADLLIPDDIESSKNSMTQTMREHLRHKTKDFTSICQHGRIVYLGTPQTVDSVYNDLPARGFDVRIWPGRFPTEDEELNYGKHLAPFITERMKKNPQLRTGGGPLGERGRPTDPGMMSEEMLTRKELDQGKAYFNLQYMLDTALSDADRYPLKLKDLMFYSFDLEDAPGKFVWTNDTQHRLDRAVGSPVADALFRPARTSDEFLPYTYKLLSVDPAGGGQNGDETGVSVLYAVNGYICVMYAGGIPGGTEPSKLQMITDLIKKWDINEVLVEKNYGNGAYTVALRQACAEANIRVGIDEVWSVGQKELRIIDSLEPIMGSHKLIINAEIPQQDIQTTLKYAVEKRPTYQFLFQLKFITREKGSLIHDDRLEAVAQGVTHLLKVINQHDKNPAAPPTDRFKGFRQDATGKWRFADRVAAGPAQPNLSNVMDRYRR
jgi:hypothetical protein